MVASPGSRTATGTGWSSGSRSGRPTRSERGIAGPTHGIGTGAGRRYDPRQPARPLKRERRTHPPVEEPSWTHVGIPTVAGECYRARCFAAGVRCHAFAKEPVRQNPIGNSSRERGRVSCAECLQAGGDRPTCAPPSSGHARCSISAPRQGAGRCMRRSASAGQESSLRNLNPLAIRCQATERSEQGDALVADAEILGRFAPYDVVLSDMAPNTTGSRITDQSRSFELFMRALSVATVHRRLEARLSANFHE